MYKVEVPWPLNNRYREIISICLIREVCLHGWLVDDLDESKRIVICFRALDPEYPLNTPAFPMVSGDGSSTRNQKAPELCIKFVRIYVDGGCQISAIDDNHTFLEIMWNIDLKTEIPQSLIGFVSRYGLPGLQKDIY